MQHVKRGTRDKTVRLFVLSLRMVQTVSQYVTVQKQPVIMCMGAEDIHPVYIVIILCLNMQYFQFYQWYAKVIELLSNTNDQRRMHKKYNLRTYLRKKKCNLISISISQSQCHYVRMSFMRPVESSDYVYLLVILFAFLLVLFIGTNKVKYWQMLVKRFSKPL